MKSFCEFTWVKVGTCPTQHDAKQIK